MPYDFWILIGFIAGSFGYIALRNQRKPQVDLREKIEEVKKEVQEQMPKPHKIKFYGGPFDGQEKEETYDAPYGFIQYHPTEDDEDKVQIGEIHGHPLYQPKVAYYRLVDNASYFYVRDVTEQEVREAEQGKPPAVEAVEED